MKTMVKIFTSTRNVKLFTSNGVHKHLENSYNYLANNVDTAI